MKNSLALLLLLFGLQSFSQGVFNNTTNSALQKVIEDYPNKFNNIKGDQIGTKEQSIDYRSKIEVPGASSNVVTKITIANTSLYTWKSQLFESSNFEISKEKFKEAFNNIKNTIVKIEGLPAFILNGKFEHPSEDKKNTTVQFQLLPANAEMQKLKVALSMVQSGSQWQLVLSVTEKDLSNETAAF